MSVKFTNQGGSDRDGNGGLGLRGNQQAVVERLIATQTPAKIRRLRQHIEKEEVARSDGDARAVIRLSGEFHCLLAELAGNSALVRTMRELSGSSSFRVEFDSENPS